MEIKSLEIIEEADKLCKNYDDLVIEYTKMKKKYNFCSNIIFTLIVIILRAFCVFHFYQSFVCEHVHIEKFLVS